MSHFASTVDTLEFPTLPAGLVWQLDRHANLIAGKVCAIHIKKFTTKKILGIPFKLSKTYGYSVTYDDNQWINEEMVALVKELS